MFSHGCYLDTVFESYFTKQHFFFVTYSKSESNLFDLGSASGVSNATDTTKMSKDSIMALFNQPQAPQQQQLPKFMTDFGASPNIQHQFSSK